jgi:glycine/D-amino acid oxidase-like deaminating enzyme
MDPPNEQSPALNGIVRADVAVIGGGLTGMAAALRLADRGADVALIEADFCGRGASSRNAGHLTPTIAGDPLLLSTLYRRRARDLIRLAENGVRFTEELIARFGIECEYQQTGNVSAALTAGQLRRSERIARLLQKAGADVDFVEAPAWGLPSGFLGGILERTGGHLHPGKLVAGLRTVLERSDVAVFEGSPVSDMRQRGGRLTVRTPQGEVHVQQVLLATNAYTQGVSPAPHRAVVPVWVTLAETEPIDPERLAATGWTSRSGIYTQHLILEDYRPTASGTVLMGTRQVQRGRGSMSDCTPTPSVVSDLLRGFRERFPSFRDVALRKTWGGWIAMTASWLPVAGDASPNIRYVLGYNGHGLAQAPYLGTLMADHMAGDSPHENLQTLWRRHPRFMPALQFSAPALRLGWAVDRVADRFGR